MGRYATIPVIDHLYLGVHSRVYDGSYSPDGGVPTESSYDGDTTRRPMTITQLCRRLLLSGGCGMVATRVPFNYDTDAFAFTMVCVSCTQWPYLLPSNCVHHRFTGDSRSWRAGFARAAVPISLEVRLRVVVGDCEADIDSHWWWALGWCRFGKAFVLIVVANSAMKTAASHTCDWHLFYRTKDLDDIINAIKVRSANRTKA